MFPVQKEREAVELDFSGNYIGGRECDYLVCVLSRADNIEILVCTSVCVCVCMCMSVYVCVEGIFLHRQQVLLIFPTDGRESSAVSSRTDGTASSVEGDRSKKHGHRRKRRKDFIKRNKEVSTLSHC